MSTQLENDLIHLDILEEKKPDPEHLENTADATVVSKYANLGLKETLVKFRWSSLFAILAAFNACNDGYCYSIPGNVIAMPGFVDKFGIPFKGAKALDAKTLAAWGAEYTAGYIAILFIGSPINDLIGRKFSILLVQIFMLISTIMSLTASNTATWGAAKIFQGLSVGLAQASVQSYISEIAPTRARGFFLAAYQLFFAVGQLTAAIATYIVNQMPADKWKHAIYSEFVLAGLALLFWGALPESPRWCAQRGKTERAKKLLLSINRGVTDYDVEEEYAIIKQEIDSARALQQASSQYSYISLFKGVNRRRLLISFGPFAWQQWSGVPVIFGYSSYFFKVAGLANPFAGTLAVFFILLAGVILSMFSIEKLGRRPGLIFGGLGLTACLVIVGGMGTITNQTATTGGVIVAFSCVWVFIYALTLAPIGYTMLAETSSVILRAKTTSIAAGMTGCLNLVVNYCTPLMLAPTGANWGVKGVSFLYAGTCFIGLVLVFFFVPETKGRSFSELDELFERRTPARKFASTDLHVVTA